MGGGQCLHRDEPHPGFATTFFRCCEQSSAGSLPLPLLLHAMYSDLSRNSRMEFQCEKADDLVIHAEAEHRQFIEYSCVIFDRLRPAEPFGKRLKYLPANRSPVCLDPRHCADADVLIDTTDAGWRDDNEAADGTLDRHQLQGMIRVIRSF
jgi:hypothetical protein